MSTPSHPSEPNERPIMTTTAPRSTSSERQLAAPPSPGLSRSLRRVLALSRLELTMLIRNRTALFNALLLAPVTVALMQTIAPVEAGEGSGVAAGTLLAMLIALALVFAGYYNLCTTAVARREELMLKRLSTGESTRTEVLVAMTVPAFAVICAQVVIGLVSLAVAIGMPPLTNVILVLLALVLGTVVMALLGYASTAFTRSVEAAQITTLLPLVALILLSGATVPLQVMPEPMRIVAEISPLGAVTSLASLGLNGFAADGAQVAFLESFVPALVPLAALVGWTVVGVVLIRRTFQWEPRR